MAVGKTSKHDQALPEKLKALQADAFKRVDAFTSQYPKLEGECTSKAWWRISGGPRRSGRIPITQNALQS